MPFPRVRRALLSVVFAAGVVGSVATTGPSADISGVSSEERVVLDAETPSARFSAVAILTAAGATTTGGEIGLNVLVDGAADASLVYTLLSDTTGEEVSGDIVDTQAQGSARVGIAAFQGCTETCTDELTIELSRTDAALDGELDVTFSLDALASTEAEAAGDIALSID